MSGTVKPRPNSRYRERARSSASLAKQSAGARERLPLASSRSVPSSKSRRKSNRKSKQTQRYTRRQCKKFGEKRKSRRSKRERDKVGRIMSELASKKRIIAPQSCCGQKCQCVSPLLGSTRPLVRTSKSTTSPCCYGAGTVCRSCFNQIMAQPSASARKCPTCRRAINAAAVTQAMCFSSGGVTSTIVISDDEN